INQQKENQWLPQIILVCFPVTFKCPLYGAPHMTSVDITTSSVLLNWTEPNGQSSRYHVEFENNSVNTENTSIEINDLAPGVQYTFRVFAVAADHVTEGRASQISLFTKPDVIMNLTANDITTSSVLLNWTKPNGQSSRYRVEYENNNVVTENNSFEINDLTPGVHYTFRVFAVAADHVTKGRASQISLYTSKTSDWMNLKVSEITTSSVFLIWEEPFGNRYFFKLNWTDGKTSNHVITNNTWYNITGLTAGVNYTFNIAAVAADKSTEGGSVVTSNYTKPDVIMNLTANDITTSSVLLNWTKPNGQSSRYHVEYENNNVATENNSFEINDLTPGVHYTFRVFAVAADHVTEGRASQISLYTKPDVIRNLRVSEITTSSVFLIWEEPFGNRYFFKLNWTDGKTSNHVITNNTWYNITGLTAGVNYTFNIAAVAADKSTEGGSDSNFIPKCLSFLLTEPDVIMNLTANDITTSSVLLNWTKPNGQSSRYHVEYENNNVATENNSFEINDLTPGAHYTFRVFAVAADHVTKGRASQISLYTSKTSDWINSGLRIEEYEEYFKRKHADSNCGFAEEYELSVCGSPFDDYINANCIPGYNSRKEFIAAQGPLPVTVNEFWRMVWEKNVYTIVMLTKCNEMGRVKCEKYWPSGTNHFHNISVTTTSEIELESWTIRDFRIKNVKTAESRYVRQFHFTAWPDHGVPQTTEVLIDFRHLVREHMEQYSRHSPTVVHCSAGVGKTGTFIAIDHLIFQIEKDSMVDIYGIVNDMRMHRPLMVQTEEQYVYLHQCAYDIIRSRTGTNVDLIYQNAAILIHTGNNEHKINNK
uniref:protein-tyrosine-phosphatase n=1 Tax=Cyprinus carpio TaxID=7962 RepID=A0A8C1J9B1_CYPCA